MTEMISKATVGDQKLIGPDVDGIGQTVNRFDGIVI